MSVHDLHLSTTTSKPLSDQRSSSRSSILKRVADLMIPKPKQATPYMFSVTEISQEFTGLTPAELARRLANLAMYIEAGPVSDWHDLRVRICTAHMALNAHREVPPMYRAWPVAHPMQPDNEMMLTFARDMQVIDMAWSAAAIRMRGCSPDHNVSEGGIASLCWNEIFDFTAASAFACNPMSLQQKREALNLPASVGYETASLQTEAEAMRWNELLGPARKVEEYMLKAGYADKHPWSSDYRWMYLADQLTKGSFGAIRDFYSYMTGQPISAHTFRSELRRVRSCGRNCLE